MKSILIVAVLLVSGTFMSAQAQVKNCIVPSVSVSPQTSTVGNSVLITAVATNTCPQSRSAEFGLEVEAACIGGYESLLHIATLTLAGGQSATFSFTYSPSCADSWLAHADTLYQRRYANESLAAFTVLP